MKGILYNKYLKSKAHEDYLIYVNQRNATKTKVQQAPMQYEQLLFQQLSSKPKAFYEYIRAKQKVVLVHTLENCN